METSSTADLPVSVRLRIYFFLFFSLFFDRKINVCRCRSRLTISSRKIVRIAFSSAVCQGPLRKETLSLFSLERAKFWSQKVSENIHFLIQSSYLVFTFLEFDTEGVPNTKPFQTRSDTTRDHFEMIFNGISKYDF